MQSILKKYWGFDTFRPLQQEIIQSVLDGKDTLALLPTGGGKSVCYQIPAMSKPGICIVVSPLIALMRDQVENLQKRGIKAYALYSGMSYREMDSVLGNCIYGDYKFLYVSPERLGSELFLERFKQMPVNGIAVDEAHCISEWGYDFRPSYMDIAKIRPYFPEIPILALTASATKPVQKDIVEKLQFQNSQVFIQSFRRKNLSYVTYLEENKMGRLIQIIRKVSGSGIVYVRNRRRSKEIAGLLKKAGIGAEHYHGGLSNDERNAKQAGWMKGRIQVIVCTNAFGMGIDKPDVRYVVHLDIPDSPEAYYQEAGRAGRDGKKAYAVNLYNPANIEQLETGHKRNFPEVRFIERVYHALGDFYQLAVGSGEGYSYDFQLKEFAFTYQLDITDTFQAVRILEKQGLIILTDALYLAPRVRVIAHRDAIHELEVSNKRLEPVIKTILRGYEGVFDQYVKINEKQLSKRLSMKLENLRKALIELQKKGIIHYEPFKDQPQLIFNKPRQDRNRGSGLDINLLKSRKKTHRSKMKSMIGYVENKSRCRQSYLLEYFGEKKTGTCGKCDICLSRKKSGLDETEFNLIQSEVVKRIQAQSSPVKDIVSDLSQFEDNKTIYVIRWMLDGGLIYENEYSKMEWTQEVK